MKIALRLRLLLPLLIAAVACQSAWAADAGGAGQAGKPQPPIIHEQFTLLPCPRHPQSTLELEGCAEHRIVRLDRRIDRVVRAVFPLLPGDPARIDLIKAQSAWIAFRKADCNSVSDKYARGTFAGVVAANCTADRSAQRLKDLRAFERLLRSP